MRRVKIVSTAKYLPKTQVSAAEIDRRIGEKEGWVAKKSGVLIRHFADNKEETSPKMGAIVLKEALNKANLKLSDLDAIISTSGTQAQEIPCTASLIQEAAGGQESGIPCFDINSTCLSFVTGLDTISYMVAAGRYKRVALISSEIASVGLNYKEKESAALMGDGAACVIIEQTPEGEDSQIITSRMETYSSGAHFAEIRGGGTLRHPIACSDVREEEFQFKMNGPAVFKQASKLMIPFCERLFAQSNVGIKDINLVIPHQASRMALSLVQKRLEISDERFLTFVENHGNTIAASIPMGIHNALEGGRIKRGDKVLLLGTSAGFSIMGLALQY